jgi:glycine cleavage system transcriptional repressor
MKKRPPTKLEPITSKGDKNEEANNSSTDNTVEIEQTIDNLVVTAIGKDRPGIVHELSKIVLEHKGNVVDSRMTVLGGEFAILLLVSGKWDTIARLEALLPKLEHKLELTIQTKRTSDRPIKLEHLPYHVEVVSIDHPGIVYEVADFFSSRQINVEEMNTSSHHAPHTGTPMFVLNIVLGIPKEESITQLRENFLDFCDSQNLDGMLEPIK